MTFFNWFKNLFAPKTPDVIARVATKKRISLYWENTTEPHPERLAWTDMLVSELRSNLAVFASATDVKKIHPRFPSLTDDQKVKALGEFFVALAYYESSFKPKENSVDVGSKEDKGSWSVGLFQMSANDDAAKAFNATFETLQDPLMNIKVALWQMKHQISLTGLFFLVNSDPRRYWATLLIGNKYNEIENIQARVLQMTKDFA